MDIAVNSGFHASYVLEARWFAGKGREAHISSVQPLAWFTDPGSGVGIRPEICTVAYASGEVEYYQVLISYRNEINHDTYLGPALESELGHAHDATKETESMAAVVNALLDPIPGDGTWQVHIAPGAPLEKDMAVRLYSGEQSNTNVFLNHTSVLKIFRKLEPGHNLDIEILDACSRAGITSVPTLHGWVTGDFVDPEGSLVRADLIMLAEQLRDARDGWDLAVHSAAENRDFTLSASRIGAALAETHRALGDMFPVTALDGAAIGELMKQRLVRAAAEVPQLTPYQSAISRLFDSLSGMTIAAQRIHGDFHLGQTLHTPDGWRIIDFEGEPLKSINERRAADSPLRDVAGMLRSFGYATSGSTDPMGATTQEWLRNCRAAFLSGYDTPYDGMETVLRAYEADKAVYEVVYEARHRPAWISIPLTALDHIIRL